MDAHIYNVKCMRIWSNIRVVFPLPVSPTMIKMPFFRTSSTSRFSTNKEPKKKHTQKKLYKHISIHKPKRTSEIPSQYPSKQYRKQLEETSCAGQFFVSCITIIVHAIIFHEFPSTKKIIFWATKQERKKIPGLYLAKASTLRLSVENFALDRLSVALLRPPWAIETQSQSNQTECRWKKEINHSIQLRKYFGEKRNTFQVRCGKPRTISYTHICIFSFTYMYICTHI